MLADLHTTGTLAHIMKMLRMPDGKYNCHYSREEVNAVE